MTGVPRIEDVLLACRRVVSVRIDAGGVWAGSLRAEAEPVRRSAHKIAIGERGELRPPHAAGRAQRLHAYNTSLWSIERSMLELSYDRGGVVARIARFPLDELARLGRAASVEPHLCDKDIYRGSIELGGNAITLSWLIEMPGGTETQVVSYR